MTTVTIDQQIAEVEREIQMRLFTPFKRCQIDSREEADSEQRYFCMVAVLETLKAVRDNPAALMRDDGK